MIRWDVVNKAMPILFEGFKTTIWVSFLSLVIAFIFSIVLTLGYISKRKWLHGLVELYIKIFRNIPFMVQLYLIYYALPNIGIRFPALWSGIVALSLYTASYFTVILKMGADSVPLGQIEAAASLRLGYFTTLRRIVFPQITGVIVPPLINQIVTSVKESSVMSVITVHELTMAANEVVGQTYAPFSVFLVACLYYWVFNSIFEAAGKIYERKTKVVKMELSI